jgi:hypothetical protein
MLDSPFPIGDIPRSAGGVAGGGHERGLYSFDGWDLSVEVEGLRTHVARVEDERTTEARKLSTLVMGICNALINLKMLCIWNVSQLLKMA